METHDPNLAPGAFGNVDTRDTHPVPGEEEQPYPPIELPSDAIYDGAVPHLPPEQSGVGGILEGDVTKTSDGYQINPPERDDE
ncbi:MAG: hypothetical protein ACRDIB_16225 [Ardenticatenaceae bacterium]